MAALTTRKIPFRGLQQCRVRHAVLAYWFTDDLAAARRLLYLQDEPLQGIDVRSVIYLVRARIENAQLIAQQIRQTSK